LSGAKNLLPLPLRGQCKVSFLADLFPDSLPGLAIAEAVHAFRVVFVLVSNLGIQYLEASVASEHGPFVTTLLLSCADADE
jgi:hypothetical protein